MHICLISPYAIPNLNSSHGGIGTFTNFYLKLLLDNNYYVTILELDSLTNKTIETTNTNFTHVKISTSKIKGLKWFFNIRKLNQIIKQINNNRKIDIIETAEQGLFKIKKLKNIKYVIRLHGGHHFFSKSEFRKIKLWDGYKEKQSFKKADGFIAVSNFVKKHTEEYLSYNNKNVQVIPSSIDMDKFKIKNKTRIVKNKILFAGRLCEKKGLKNLILALPIVKQKHPDCELHIYGKDSLLKLEKKSYKEFLHKEILSKINNYKSYIFFNKELSQKDLIVEMSSSQTCVFPSLMETQGLIALEAMALKKLVIFTKHGPGKELIKDKINGVLCDSYNIKSIAKAIIWSLDLKSTERQVIENNARQTIIEKYDSKNFLLKNINFYKTL